MECLILGCGGSSGVPQIGCSCWVCKSSSPYNKRTRSSILIRNHSLNLLIDTSPDLRCQFLTHNIRNIDAVLFTHAHFDHIGGIADLKLCKPCNKPIPAFMDVETHKRLLSYYPYVFAPSNPIYSSVLEANIFHSKFYFQGIHIIPFRQEHGRNNFSYGFRIGDFAYSTDLTSLPSESLEKLKGVKIWVLDCLRYSFAPTHSYLPKTLDFIAKVKPQLTILTHMSHEIGYHEINKITPDFIKPAFDGMVIRL